MKYRVTQKVLVEQHRVYHIEVPDCFDLENLTPKDYEIINDLMNETGDWDDEAEIYIDSNIAHIEEYNDPLPSF